MLEIVRPLSEDFPFVRVDLFLVRDRIYFGELTFWWGLYLFGLAADPGYVWTIVGPMMMTGMFVGVSIPWMDRRSCERRPEYAEHMKRVSGLVPWFPKKSS